MQLSTCIVHKKVMSGNCLFSEVYSKSHCKHTVPILSGSQRQFEIKVCRPCCEAVPTASNPLFDLGELSVDFKSVCNHFNLSAAGVEQIIVIYLIEN